jgi:predicted TIM-barrel fold metal-dependent hydrolase
MSWYFDFNCWDIWSSDRASKRNKDCIDNFGYERILFGSDFLFGYPKEELLKILNLSIPQEKEVILGQNLKRLLADSSIADRGWQKAESRIM